LIHRIDELGEETTRTVRGKDMTATKADLDARASALAASVAHLQQLMSHSGSIGDLVGLENQLTQRIADLESLQAQRRALVDQLALGTVTVEVTAPVPPARRKPAPEPTGFVAAVIAGWHAIVLAARWLFAGVGDAVPFLVLSLGALAIVHIRRRRRRSTVPVTR
jgi:hypothetical protein